MSVPTPASRLTFDVATPYREMIHPPLPSGLRALALACFAAQRRAAAEHAGGGGLAGSCDAASAPQAASPEALEGILARGQTVGGIVTRREVATSYDRCWHLRFFAVSAERRFWHAVHSDTQRFSVGWMLRRWSPGGAALAAVERLLGL
jgi:hypothetical protein